ncbi:MAG: hypothetical protein KDD67_06550 [Ignavibacteriae bacterium]|nr:hypothetical protein [Ignavibacteriota bacterium]MCB9215596.1 hypothetical protein [Ignavibacteria bacterium]
MRLVYTSELLTEPIAEELRRKGWETIASENPGADVVAGKAEVAIGSALDYSRHLGLTDYALVPDFGIITYGIAGLIRITFPPGRESLSSIAVHSLNSASTILAGILLIEKHGIEPNFVEVSEDADLQVMFEAADGAVLSGDSAINSLPHHSMALDLSDEWEDLTDAPLPYTLAWGRTGHVPSESIDELLKARDQMVLTFPDRIAQSESPEGLQLIYERYLSGSIQFSLPREEASNILTPLFHYPFYHGIISDIPTVKFLDELPETPAEGDE